MSLDSIDFKAYLPIVSQYAIKLVGALVVLLLVWMVSNMVRRIVRKSLERVKFDLTLSIFLAATSRWLVLVIGIVGCLGIFGIETTSLAAVLGAAGLAVGLAFQGSLSNLASGIMLLIFRPFKVGDFIRAGGETGTVAEIGLFSTAFDTPDNRRVIIPNSAIFGSNIENVTFHERRRVDVAVGASYDADIDATRSALESAIEAIDSRIEDANHQVMLLGLGASSVDWSVRVWVATPDYWASYEKLVRAVKMRLDEAGIGIPYPQMDVHLDAAQGIELKNHGQ